MKKLLIAVAAVAVSFTLTAGSALAGSCPKLIKQGREAAAKMEDLPFAEAEGDRAA